MPFSSIPGRAADAVVAFVFPQGCHVCGEAVSRTADGVACSQCWADPRVTTLFDAPRACPTCGFPGPGPCAPCAPEGISALRSAGAYAGALRACLLDAKRRPAACRRLLSLVSDLYARESALHASEIVVPVPLHPDRLVERGHNQAESLAAAVARTAGIELVPSALARRRAAVKRRGGADPSARATAVRGAFRAARRIVVGRTVLLVDDVFTTGATLAACAGALRDAGALDVLALTAARTLKKC